ncbi:MAG: nucleotidyltransferase family protein [Sulfolobales archaeon]|nr:nucleotidyltransferase family protein [Sulfolobales archaeon]MDW7969746.1 nucleotidyltransferase family protein [Sulfolobales archaeon]
MKAAIIAGGFGKRLRPLTNDRPKPLVEVGGKAVIEWQIGWLRKYGVSTFVLLTGYLREVLIDYLGSGSKFGIKVTYVVEDEPLGTGGALKNAENVLNDSVFIAVNGDVITNLDVSELVRELVSSDALATIALVPLKSPYGIVRLGRGGCVESFVEKPVLKEYLINAGVYALKPEAFKHIPERGDLERVTFPKLASEGLLKGVVFEGCYWKSIDTIKDVEEASKDLEQVKF